MRRAAWWTIALVILVGAIIAYYFWMLNRITEPAPASPALAPPAAPGAPAGPEASAPPPIQYPIEPLPPTAAEATAPLPALEHSDAEVRAALERVLGRQSWTNYFLPDLVIRRIVATVDNLPRKAAPARMMPVKPVPGPFRASDEGGTLTISPTNDVRYAGYVNLMRQVSIPALVDLYVRFYPLFQRAYEELGFPNRYFNDRLIEAIDNLLAAPEPESPPALVQPKVLYQFADPDLEARSAGQKIMMRIGRANEMATKETLRTLRREVIRRTSARPAPS